MFARNINSISYIDDLVDMLFLEKQKNDLFWPLEWPLANFLFVGLKSMGMPTIFVLVKKL